MPFNKWNRLLWLSTNLSIEDFHLDTGTDEILASIYKPLDDRNDKDNTKCRNAVIYHVELALFFCITKKREPTYSCCYQWQAGQGGRERG